MIAKAHFCKLSACLVTLSGLDDVCQICHIGIGEGFVRCGLLTYLESGLSVNACFVGLKSGHYVRGIYNLISVLPSGSKGSVQTALIKHQTEPLKNQFLEYGFQWIYVCSANAYLHKLEWLFAIDCKSFCILVLRAM